MTFIPMHAQQLVIIQWMDSCIPKEEEDSNKLNNMATVHIDHRHLTCFW